MDPIDSALTQLRSDRADLDDLYGVKAVKDANAAQAVNEQAVAGNALAGGINTFNQDKTALITLIQSTLNSGPPSPPAPVPEPPAPPVVPAAP